MLKAILFSATLSAAFATNVAIAEPPTSQPTTQPAQARDLAEYRKQFPTQLTLHGPPPASWQDATPLVLPKGVAEVTYNSGDLKLKAWLSDIPKDDALHPAVVFCHGGFWFGNDDWSAIKPLLDAGFVVMMPRVRGENGNPGEFDDVNAAGAFLASQPGIEARRLFVSGHSAGGDLAALAVMMEGTPFKLSAPIGASLDVRPTPKSKVERQRDLIVFDGTNLHELEQRSALLFTAGLRAPIHLFRGDADGPAKVDLNFVMLAHHFKKEATLVKVAGDHGQSLTSAMPQVAAFFKDYSLLRHVIADLPHGWQNQSLKTSVATNQTAANSDLTAYFALLSQPRDLFRSEESLTDSAASVTANLEKTSTLIGRVDSPIQSIKLAGRDIATFDSTGKLPSGLALHYRHYFVVSNHYFIGLTCWAAPDNFEAARPDFEKLVGSVHESGE